ncbi:MAG: FAD-binding oxidoreductase [Candidatus Nomurabacteria bacterium]|nr:MAG: FAD-binding oxidoreductase [Candidatus Nomurabacteria bacterium]
MAVSTSTTIPVVRAGAKSATRKTRVSKKTSKSTTKASSSVKVKVVKPKMSASVKVAGAGAKTKTKATVKTKIKKNTTSKTASVPVTAKVKVPTVKRHPLGHLLIEKMFREAGFRGGISSDKHVLEKYSTDESIFSIKPQVVIQPKTKHDVELATKVIARETKRFSSLSLTPRAAGTGLSGGSLTDSIVVDVSTHLHQIGEIKMKKDESVTITCEPGVMWRDVEKKLKRAGAYIPSYTASKDICTVGGSVSNNAAGPDSLRYGHCADWVEELEVVLADGVSYAIKPLTYKEYQKLIKHKHEYAKIAEAVFSLIAKNEKEIQHNRPDTPKNTAGYALWHVLSTSVADFKKGQGTFDLSRLIAGSQGTIGIITNITMRAIPVPRHTTLIAVPVFDLAEAGKVVNKALKHNPLNLEVFDALTFDLALNNPDFFKKRLDRMDYYRGMLSLYTTYHVRYGRRTPALTILITLDDETTTKMPAHEIVNEIRTDKAKARIILNPIEEQMLWLVRRSSYTLSKLQDSRKRPAAFLEDMTVPPQNLSKFLVEIQRLFKEFNITAAIHGHGGNGHFHFYPLLDFTQRTTGKLIEKMSDRFYETALKYGGSLCGEHNDGIIRTPHLSKMFTKKMLDIFAELEQIFDPDDIFNPGKKVNPRFDIRHNIRNTN